MNELNKELFRCLECKLVLSKCTCNGALPLVSLGEPKGIPHRCPVCDGRGQVFNGFYPQTDNIVTIGPEHCRTCSGLGLVWG